MNELEENLDDDGEEDLEDEDSLEVQVTKAPTKKATKSKGGAQADTKKSKKGK